MSKYYMHVCESCDTGFAVQDVSEVEWCPVCADDDITYTGEVIVNPNIVGEASVNG